MAEFASKGVAGSALGLAIGGLSAALLNNDGDGPLNGLLGGGSKKNEKIADLMAENTLLKSKSYTDAEIKGEVGQLILDLSGASDLESPVVNKRYGLVCNSCEGFLSGASDAYLHCDGTISLSLSGSSDLYYTGDATTNACSTSGGSKIKHERL